MRFVLFFVTAALAIAGQFSTSIGDVYPFQVSAVTTDSAGNTYVVGSRLLVDETFTGAFLSVLTPVSVGILPVTSFSFEQTDVFVTKLDPTGKVLFTDTFAGKGSDSGSAIALDPSGNIYIAGSTTSDDFTLSKALQTQPNTDGTGFIVKLSNDGSTILYSTYFGGTLGTTSITSLATDSQGNLYLTGNTSASDFPHTAGMPFGQVSMSPQVYGAIVAAISAAGDKIRYSGVLVGNSPVCQVVTECPVLTLTTSGVGIAVDPAGNAYVAGNTNATDLPTTKGVLSPSGVGAFIAKVNAAGSGLSYLTYIDSAESPNSNFPSAANTLNAIAVDTAGNAYLAGSTCDPDFPTTPGSVQPVYAGGGPPNSCSPDGFLAKLKTDASAMLWATYLGGIDTSVESIAIDAFGNVWATGSDESIVLSAVIIGASTVTDEVSTTPLPNTNGWSTGPEFVAGLNAAGSKLTYSALYPAGTVARSVALDPAGLVHTAGANGFISVISPYAGAPMGIFGFENAAGSETTARLSPAEVISIFGPGIGPATAVTAAPSGGFYPKSVAGVEVSIDGMNMPLLYVSANQINAVVPMEIPSEAAATVHVTNGATTSADYPVWVAAAEPQAFPATLNQDGTLNSSSNPARSGSIVTFYATGWQSGFAPLADGEVATAAQDSCRGNCSAASLGVMSAPIVLYGGAAPGIVAGVTQFNLRLGTIEPNEGTNQVGVYLSNSSSTSTVTQNVWVAP
ncbi:MAG: SBBP repeat-containing protein [Bryobacteraceae bacterium]|jgi:uncharacterized protein (TIGR03437 family)